MNLNNYNKTSEVIDNKSDKISNFSSDKLPLEESKRKKNIEEEKDSIKSTENKKDDNNDNDNNDNNNNNNKICYKCNSNENETYYFSCNHLTCIECIIKDLLLNKFKKLENQKRINFNCSCHLGSIKIDYETLTNSIKKFLEPKNPGNCREHNEKGEKFCKICNLWLCKECLNIHKVFNSNHELSNNQFTINHNCLIHGDINKYYCINCKCEICGNCLIKGEKHFEHKFFPLSNFKDLINEIKQKIKLKNFNDFLDYFNEIEDYLNKKKEENCNIIFNKIDEIIEKLNLLKNEFEKDINEKYSNLVKTMEIIKLCYSYFYKKLENEEQTLNNLNFLEKIEEIKNIEITFSNFDESLNCINLITQFEKNNHLIYKITNKENPYPFKYNKYEKVKKQSKETLESKGFKREKTIKTIGETIYSIIKLPEINRFACSIGKNILIMYDISLENKKVLTGHTRNITCITLLKEKIIISGSEDKTLRLWNYEEEKCLNIITAHYEKIDSLLTLSENKIAIGAYNTIRIYNIDKKKEEYNLIGHDKSICSLIKINSNIIASGSYDNSIKLYNLKEKSVQFTLFGNDSPIYCLILLKDGRLGSGSGSYDKSLKIWNLKEKNCEFTLLGHKREIRALDQLDNGFLISASMDKTVKIWNIYKRLCVQTLSYHFDVVYAVCVLSNERIVTGGRDQDLVLWKNG